MRTSVARLKGAAYIIWHARHMLYHAFIGLVWAWALWQFWHEFTTRWIWISILGSLLPDLDHVFYFITYGKSDTYTKDIAILFKKRKWRALTILLENGHKHQTNLSYHNVYFMIFLVCLSFFSSAIDWEAGVILFGAMVLHYLFDIFDDFLILGSVNPNWKRWGRRKVQLATQNISE